MIQFINRFRSSISHLAKMSLNPQEKSALRHWSTYGRPGEQQPGVRRATFIDWQTKQFSKPITSTWNATVPATEIGKLLHGFRPQAMEDKWFVYAEGPDELEEKDGIARVHMYRSWTGFKLVELKMTLPVDLVEKGESAGARITEIIWESDDDRIGHPTEEGSKRMAVEVCRWVMGVNLEIPE
jgi:hypothetical protein